MESLEAMRLFLAVPKMSFVIAADEDRVSDAIRTRFSDIGRPDESDDERQDPATLYLHKIVQTTIPLPAATSTAAVATTGPHLAAIAAIAASNEPRTASATHQLHTPCECCSTGRFGTWRRRRVGSARLRPPSPHGSPCSGRRAPSPSAAADRAENARLTESTGYFDRRW